MDHNPDLTNYLENAGERYGDRHHTAKAVVAAILACMVGYFATMLIPHDLSGEAKPVVDKVARPGAK